MLRVEFCVKLSRAIILLLIPIAVGIMQESYTFKIYGSMGCPSCKRTYDYLVEIYGANSVIMYDTANSTSYMVREIELSLLLYNNSRVTPIVGVFRDGELIAVSGGKTVKEFWANIGDKTLGDGVEIFLNGELYNIITQKTVEKVEEIFGSTEEPPSRGKSYSFRALSVILVSAVADSVNPCTFSIFTALLILSASSRGFGHAGKLGLSFIAAIFTCYYLMGLGLTAIVLKMLWLRPILACIAVALGAYEVWNSVGEYYRSVMPKPLRKIVSPRIEEAASKAGPVGTFLLGVIISFTLLPCSGGPYLIAASVLAEFNMYSKLGLLLLYNLVFIAPLLLILVGVLYLGLKLRKLKYWRGTKLQLMGMVSGFLLIGIGLYMFHLIGMI